MPDIDYGEILEALNDKVDLSGSWSAPSDNVIALSSVSSGGTITAVDDGYIHIDGTAGSGGGWLSMGRKNVGGTAQNAISTTQGNGVYFLYPVAKGKVYEITFYNMSSVNLHFVYAQKTN